MSDAYKIYASQEYVDERVNNIQSVPTGGAPHQMLVTDADGKTVWEERTHYSDAREIAYTFDGNKEGMEYFAVPEMGDNSYMVKVSDDTPDPSDLLGGKALIYRKGYGVIDELSTQSIQEKDVAELVGGVYMVGSEYCMVVQDYTNVADTGFTSNGIWVALYGDDNSYFAELSYTVGTTKMIDKKYIPISTILSDVIDIVPDYDGSNWTYTPNVTFEYAYALPLPELSIRLVYNGRKKPSDIMKVNNEITFSLRTVIISTGGVIEEEAQYYLWDKNGVKLLTTVRRAAT